MTEIVKGVERVGKFWRIGHDYYEKIPTGRYNVKAFDLGAGHIEAVTQPEYEMHDLCDYPAGLQRAKAAFKAASRELTPEEEAERTKEREERSREKAAKRAKTGVRRLCKVMGADTLLTLTYRGNQTDLDLCKKHLREFVRRLRRTIPGFRAVAAFERQDRGAWHVHMATERVQTSYMQDGVRVKSYNLIRSVWRSVTGELQGTANLKGKGPFQRSAARIAAYISKYITKAFQECDSFVNRWTRFGEIEVPKSVPLGTYDNHRLAVVAMYSLLESGHTVVDSFLSKYGDFCFVIAEKTARPPIDSLLKQ